MKPKECVSFFGGCGTLSVSEGHLKNKTENCKISYKDHQRNQKRVIQKN